MFLKKVPQFMSLAALMQDPTVSNLFSLGCELTKQGFHPVAVSPKRMKSIFSSLACIFPFIISVKKTTQILGSEHRNLKESLFWAGTVKKKGIPWEPRGDFGMGTKMMHFHLDAKCTSGENGGENLSS